MVIQKTCYLERRLNYGDAGLHDQTSVATELGCGHWETSSTVSIVNLVRSPSFIFVISTFQSFYQCLVHCYTYPGIIKLTLAYSRMYKQNYFIVNTISILLHPTNMEAIIEWETMEYHSDYLLRHIFAKSGRWISWNPHVYLSRAWVSWVPLDTLSTRGPALEAASSDGHSASRTFVSSVIWIT